MKWVLRSQFRISFEAIIHVHTNHASIFLYLPKTDHISLDSIQLKRALCHHSSIFFVCPSLPAEMKFKTFKTTYIPTYYLHTSLYASHFAVLKVNYEVGSDSMLDKCDMLSYAILKTMRQTFRQYEWIVKKSFGKKSWSQYYFASEKDIHIFRFRIAFTMSVCTSLISIHMNSSQL